MPTSDKILQEVVLPPEEVFGVKIIESDDDDKDEKLLELKLIQKGWSKNGYFYSKNVAESVAKITKKQNRMKMFMNHGFGWFGRGLEEWAATLEKTSSKDGASYGVARMTENPKTAWLYQEAEKDPTQIGASISARAKIRDFDAKEDKILTAEDGFKALHKEQDKYVVEEIVFMESTDFVTYAAAGGGIEQVLAGEGYIDPITALKNLQISHDNLMETLNKLTQEKTMTLTLTELEKDHPELVEAIRTKALAEQKEDKSLEEKIEALEADVTSLQEKVTEAETERDNLQVKNDNYKVKEDLDKKKLQVESLIKEADLPEEAITEVFKKTLINCGSEEEMKEHIADRATLVDGTSGEVAGNGPRKKEEELEEGTKVDKDSLVLNIKKNRK